MPCSVNVRVTENRVRMCGCPHTIKFDLSSAILQQRGHVPLNHPQNLLASRPFIEGEGDLMFLTLGMTCMQE